MRFKFIVVTVQHGEREYYDPGSESPSGGVTAKGAGQINSTHSKTHLDVPRLRCLNPRGFGSGAGILAVHEDARTARTKGRKCRTKHGQAA